MSAQKQQGRYCGPCDLYWPSGVKECRLCGADTDKAPTKPTPKVVDLMEALRKALAKVEAKP